ncbi:GFA family protein [Maritalea sp.]|uniref:GFA family protein n=1 Tax=Maritalea sp. TaxID=2003361 RepID=UPI003EF10C7D
MSETIHTGGCQCGAVRFKAHGDEFASSICHCRMCQKQTGGYFGAFATFADNKVEWSRGEVSYFVSSNIAKRGFCKDCGTPLTYEWHGDGVSLAIGAFDDPDKVAPNKQLATKSRIQSFDTLHKLKVREDTYGVEQSCVKLQNFQHPDHDTTTWPKE